MNRLIKVASLQGYRFFQNFKWNESNCTLFERYNIIYGWNGSGKTTFCDFLNELGAGDFSEPNIKFSLLFSEGNNPSVTCNKQENIPSVFHVYHNKYIQENIAEVDKVKHIFAIGSTQKEGIEELSRLKSEYANAEKSLKLSQGELKSSMTSFETLKSSLASQIKNAANYPPSYNKTKFYANYKALSSPQILSQDEYQKAIKGIAAEKKDDIPTIQLVDFIKPTVKDYVLSIIRETPTNIAIEALTQDNDLNKWVEQGLSIHESKKIEKCQFCGEKIPVTRLDELKAHFDESYKKLSAKIDGCISKLQGRSGQFEVAVASLPSPALFYAEFKDNADSLCKSIKELSSVNIAAIANLISILADKKNDMINTSFETLVDDVVAKMGFDYSCFSNLCELINVNNNKTKQFQQSIEDAQRKIEHHMLSEAVSEINSNEKVIKEKEETVEKQKTIISGLKSRIGELETQIKNSQIPADEINKDITFITGRNDLVFENTSVGYRILRNGQKATNLSKGEENAIALIYFFNALTDVSVNIENTIVVLDDPISSFDSNFYYNAIAYIREKSSVAGQVFLFTHKFALLKDYTRMYNEHSNRYIIKRVNNSPSLINEDKLIEKYHDEYAYLFKQICLFVQSPPSEADGYLIYPNVARRLLEGFLTFKIPNKDDLLTKVHKLEAEESSVAGRAMLRLLNNHSHLRVITDSELSEDITSISALPSTLQHLLDFIKKHDERHFNTLASQCEVNLDEPSSEVNNKIIKLYYISASAGSGNSIDSDDYEDYETPYTEADFAVRISGNSMEPVIPDGSIVLVKRSENVDSKKEGIFYYDGSTYCKRIIESANKTLLVSINKEYEPIEVLEGLEFVSYGEVIGVIS